MALTPDARRKINEQSSSAGWYVLLSLYHEDLDFTIRVTNNDEAIVHKAHRYEPFWFKVKLPDEDEDGDGAAQLSISAVDQRVVVAVRQLQGTPKVDLTLVEIHEPDAAQVGPLTFGLFGVSVNAGQLTGYLKYDDGEDATIPKDAMSPTNFPGIF